MYRCGDAVEKAQRDHDVNVIEEMQRGKREA